MQYKVRHHDIDAFSKMVEEMLNHGWKLQGNITVKVTSNGGMYYIQALTNEQDSTDEDISSSRIT